MKILLHIGCFKTGTTLMQEHVLKKHSDQLLQHGFVFRENEKRMSFEIVNKIAEAAKSPPSYSNCVNYVINRIQRWSSNNPGKNLIISSEKFFGTSMESFDSMEKIAEISRDIFSRWDTRVVAFVRRQDTYLESTYIQKIKSEEVLTFNEYKQKYDLLGIKWDEKIDYYKKYFSVSVFPYEDLLSDPQKYMDNFLSPFGFTIKIDSNLPIINPSTTTEGINRILKRGSISRELRHEVETHNPKKPGSDFELFAEDERKQLLIDYAESNNNLFIKYIKGYNNIYLPEGLK